MRFLLGANAFMLKTTETKSCWQTKKLFGHGSQCRSRSHFAESETCAFLSSHWTKTVPARRFFYEIFYWQGLLKQPRPNTHTHTHSRVTLPPTPTAPARQRRCKPTSPGFNFVFWPGRGREPCRHKQTPAERRWKPAAMLALLSTMHTFRDGWHRRSLWRASPAHRVSEPRPRPPRDGTGWGACRRGCQAPGRAPVTGTWQREAWFTIFIRQTRTRNVNVSAHFQNSVDGGITGRRKAGAVLFGHLRIKCWTSTIPRISRLLRDHLVVTLSINSYLVHDPGAESARWELRLQLETKELKKWLTKLTSKFVCHVLHCM